MFFDNLGKRATTSKLGFLGPQEILGQATKGKRWMPRRGEAMKDVVSCEKLRQAANKRRPGDVRMGEPGLEQSGSSVSEFIGGGSKPREVNHLSTWRKRKKIRFPE